MNDTTRLALRDDVYYARTANGVAVLTHGGLTSLAGQSIYQWLDRIAPFLDGQHTLAELTAALTPERAEFVTRLVTSLLDRDAVRPVTESPTESDPDVVFTSYFRNSAADAVARCRDSRITLVGSGELATAVLRAAELVGLTGMRQAAADEFDSDSDEALRLCDPSGNTLVRARVTGTEIWLAMPAETDSGLSSGWRRLVAMAPASTPDSPSELANTLCANHIVHELCRHLTGIRPRDAVPTLHRFDTTTLATSAHRFVPHPFAVRPREATRDGKPLDSDEFSRRAIRCSGDRLGLFGDISEGDLAQIPLHVASTTVSDPVGLLDGRRPVVTGFGLDFATARYQTALRALATYGSLMVDPRLLVDQDDRPLIAPDADPDTALALLRSGDINGFAHGVRLTDDEPVLVPADQAFPALRQGRPGIGAAAAYSWHDAVRDSLIQHARARTIAAAADRLSHPIDLDDIDLDAATAYCRTMLAATGEPCTVSDITGTLGIPTVHCRLGDRLFAYGCGMSPGAAVADGILRLLLRYQSHANEQPPYDQAEPPITSQPGPRRPMPTIDDRTLVAGLATDGRVPVAVPLDHDRHLHALIPYIVTVVMTDAQP